MISWSRPNPFNPTTRIEFTLAKKSNTRLAVYDLSGRLVRVLLDKELQKGTHQSSWDGKTDQGYRISSGVYFILLESGGEASSKKVVLVR